MKLFLSILAFSSFCFGYLYTDVGGKKLKWNLVNDSIELWVNPSDINSSEIEAGDVRSAVEESVVDWNSAGPISLRPVFTLNPPSLSTGATFRFSDNPAFFGSGVLAVTSVSYHNTKGSIYSADILMNDTLFNSSTFTKYKSSSSGSKAYVGDVISHELGHLFGLNHSEVAGSTMTFSVFKEQHSLHSDDIKGVESLYLEEEMAYGEEQTGIKGQVVGLNMVPVFGAHVQAINLKSNETIAGVFTDENGEFHFKGLAANESYTLFMAPIRSKENLPAFYSTFQSAYCDGNSFQPSFFSKCGGGGLGKAQAIRVEPGEVVEVGAFTIRCATGSHPQYLRQKVEKQAAPFVVFDYLDSYKSNSTFTGYFTPEEIKDGVSGKGDKLLIDLSGLDLSQVGQAYLKISVSTEKLNSAVGVRVLSKREGALYPSAFTFGSSPVSGKPQLDYSFLQKLSPDSDSNLFELTLYPVELEKSEKTAVFAAPEALANKEAIYFLSMEVQTAGPNGLESLEFFDDYPYEGNSRCLEGSLKETAQGYSPITEEVLQQNENETMSCATIDAGGSGPSGGGIGSFFFGLSLSISILAIWGRRNEFFV